MTLPPIQAIATVLILAAVTYLTRALPFWLFPGGREMPPLVRYLGRVLPHAIMGMLLVFCLKDVDLLTYPHGIPEGIALLSAALLYRIRKSTLLCIGVSSVLYMILVQAVF